ELLLGLPLVGEVLLLGHARHLQLQMADRKSTRLNSSHVKISYAVFCLKKKKQTLLLEKIQKGKKINLKNIQFYGNEAKFLPQARGDLKSLLEFMQLNPSLQIEVEGHVNGPNQRNSKEYQQLSEDRAKAVKNYLIENGIDATRIASVGYGNTQMLFPQPKSQTEMSANRRVEIKIIDN